MKRICLINGSLRGEAASSLRFLRGVDRLLDDREFEKSILTVQALVPGAYPEEMLKILGSAHALVIAFPLFSYSIPGALMRLLEDYNEYANRNRGRCAAGRVYAIVNCGFAEPEINAEAIRVMRNFCRSAGLEWRFALSIGCGPVAVMTGFIPLLNMRIRKGFREIAEDIRRDGNETRDTFLVKPVISKAILLAMRDRMEHTAQARCKIKLKLSNQE